jgi:hypothetical protein
VPVRILDSNRFGHADDGSNDELRSRSGKTEKGLGGQSPLERHQARLYGGEVVRLRGSLHIEHSLARRGAEKLWKLSTRSLL